MVERSRVPAVSTFVIRLWREWSVVGPSWRGRIDHVQSGESAAFCDLYGMLGFLRRFRVTGDDSWAVSKEE